MQNNTEVRKFLTLAADVPGALERAERMTGIPMASLTDLIEGRDHLSSADFDKLSHHMRLFSGYTQATGGGYGTMRVQPPAPATPALATAPRGPVAVESKQYNPFAGGAPVVASIAGPGKVKRLLSPATVHSAAEYEYEDAAPEPVPSVARRVAETLGMKPKTGAKTYSMGDLGSLTGTG